MVARSLTLRALIAVGFLVGFYTLAGALGIGLLVMAVLIVTEARRIPVQLLFVMVVAGGTILWSLIPPRNKFEPPGPEITKNDQPRLFAVIEEIARAMQQTMPAKVYAVAEVNAFVTQIGGFLGFGGRRVMGIGLGLLAADNISQLRATIAHEFGHYAGGDTKLGGFIYTTRTVMIRTVENLSGSWFQAPFVAMLKVYLRLTNAISRQQELLADEWGVRIAGKTAHVTGLRAEALHGAAFNVFLRQEVGTLIGRGVAPDNVYSGYRAFAGSSAWQNLQPVLNKLTSEQKPDPYDTHPALEDRIAYAEKLDLPDQPIDPTPAASLLEVSPGLEEQLSRRMLPENLNRVSWSEASSYFAKDVLDNANCWQARNPEVDLGGTFAALRDPLALAPLLERAAPYLIGANYPNADRDRRRAASSFVSSYIGALLAERGFVWSTRPGEPLGVEKDGVSFVAHTQVEEVLDGKRELKQLEDEVYGLGLSPADRLSLSREVAEKARTRRASVVLSEVRGAVTLSGEFTKMAWPRCCAICCGAAEIQFELQLSKSEEMAFELELGCCSAHQREIERALVLVDYVDATDMIRLEVKSKSYAELVERVNA